MQVILLERIEKLGQMGDIVTVRPGYARNYLLPQQKAQRATKENIARFEERRVQLEADNLERRQDAEKVAGKMVGMTVSLIRQAGESGQLYGSVNARDLATEISEGGVTVERRQIQLDHVIKSLGLHPVRVRLHPEVVVTVTANVARSEEEAALQARTGHMVSAEEQRERQESAQAEVLEELAEAEAAAEAEPEAVAGEEAPEASEAPSQ